MLWNVQIRNDFFEIFNLLFQRRAHFFFSRSNVKKNKNASRSRQKHRYNLKNKTNIEMSKKNPNSEKKINPVYAKLVKAVQDKISKTKLTNDQTTRVFMAKTDLFSSEDEFSASKEFFSSTHSKTTISLSDRRVCDEMEDHTDAANTLAVIYAPFASPHSTLNTGTPCEITDLVIRSSLGAQLNADSMKLDNDGRDNKERFVRLFATTSVLFENVTVDRTGFETSFDPYTSTTLKFPLAMLSDVSCVLKHWTDEGRTDIKVPDLLYLKIMTPFRIALKMNAERTENKQPLISRIVIGDVGLTDERGIHSLFCKTLQRVVRQFEGCFSEVVVVCSSVALKMYAEIADVNTAE